MELPQDFLERMREQLGEEFDAYQKSYEEKSVQGLRVNTDKISVEDFLRMAPFHLEPVPWTDNGFYTEETDAVTKHPYYFAGLYYVQEPSAMLPAALLSPKPGDRVLDLCAAPGGKATELGGRLHREGLLVANDISHSRAKALLKNLELSGIGNLFVCSDEPEKLAGIYESCFDKILVDAPCSGEGMFRRDPSVLKAYQERGPRYYARIQKNIVEAAVRMLKPGGQMVYSTCTFSREEDEDIVQFICENHPDMEQIDIKRLFPHQVKGEGHFAALLQKKKQGTDAAEKETASFAGMKECRAWELFCQKNLNLNLSAWKLTEMEHRIYAILPQGEIKKKVRYLRTGLFLGEQKQNRFVPSQALAMFLKKEEARSVLSFSSEDNRVIRYLKGETLELTEEELPEPAEWTLVCVDGYPLGWGKCINGSLKNKYYPGWRMM